MLPSILEALKDNNDDVKAVAADTLVPVTKYLIETLPNEVIINFFSYAAMFILR